MKIKNLKSVLLCLLCVSYIGQLNAQNVGLEWVRQMGGTKNDYAEGVAVDKNGNVYTTGYFQDIAYFDLPGSNDSLTANGTSSDFFVTKHNAAGDLIWSRGMAAQKMNRP